jgi:membrane-associated phospholipid phosphatase
MRTHSIAFVIWLGLAGAAAAQAPNAVAWRPWVLSSGQELRLAPPPDEGATAAELEEVRSLSARRDAAVLERIRLWDFRSPAHHWNETLTGLMAPGRMSTGLAARAFALTNVAIHDALLAAWDSKRAHSRRRPSELDPQLSTALPVPASPSYPCEHAAAAGAAAAVIAHIYPNEAQRLARKAEEAAQSRIMAGLAFPSDAAAGLDLGRKVAERVLERFRIPSEKWAGTVPVGPGLWKGESPTDINDVAWRPLVIATADQFRPPPPPAPDSAERAAELAEVKGFKRTPLTNGKASFWQFGQQGQPGLIYKLSEEVGLRLAEDGERDPRRSARAYAAVHAAHYDGWIASQDGKFHYWTARPNHFDPTVTTIFPTPPFPGYPSNAATLGAAPAVVLSYLFPREAARYAGWVKEWGESRFWAGIHFRSDIDAGWEIGRRVGEATVERIKADGALN